MTYNELLTFASNNGYDWSQGRKKAQVQAFYDSFQTETTETQPEIEPVTEITEIVHVPSGAIAVTTDTDTVENITLDPAFVGIFLVTFARIAVWATVWAVCKWVLFLIQYGPVAYGFGRYMRRMAGDLATQYHRVSFRIIHGSTPETPATPTFDALVQAVSTVSHRWIAYGAGVLADKWAVVQGRIAAVISETNVYQWFQAVSNTVLLSNALVA